MGLTKLVGDDLVIGLDDRKHPLTENLWIRPELIIAMERLSGRALENDEGVETATHLVLLMQNLALLRENNGLCHSLGIHWVIPFQANKQISYRVHQACEDIFGTHQCFSTRAFIPISLASCICDILSMEARRENTRLLAYDWTCDRATTGS